MPLKTSSFLPEYHPNTYMEQFCKSLHPDLELDIICVTWFRQATEHCTDLLNHVKPQTTFFWTTVKNFIFPDRTTTELLNQQIPISIHPKRLSLQDCQSLFLDIVSDYIQRAPRYAAESETNAKLWQVLYSIMGIMVLGSLLVGIIFTYNKYVQPKAKKNLLEEIFTPEKRMQVLNRRSLRLAKAELRNIHIKPVPKVEDIIPADGSSVLAVKIASKYEFLDSLIKVNLHSVGKFHRLYDQYSKTKADLKIESLNKAMKFVDNNCKRIHLLLMFEQDISLEADEPKLKSKSGSPRVTNMSSPLAGKLPFATSKGMLNARLEAGGFGYKAGLPASSSRSNSPKFSNSPKQDTTPRSSAIPCKRSYLTRKSK